MADSIYTFDPVPANNTALDSIPYGPNQLYHNQIDNWFRALGSKLAQFVDDLGAVNTVAGTGDAVTVTLASGITAYATGQFFRFIAGAANTGAATMNVNSIGIKAIRKISGGTDVALSAGDLAAGVTYELVYRASANAAAGAWVLVGSSVAAATTSAAGIVELATSAETITGTDTTRAVTPSGLTARLTGESRITLGTAVASTSGTSIDFTSIPSWVRRIGVHFSGVSLSGTSDILVQLGDSGGIESTGYTGGGSVLTTAVQTTNSTAGFIVFIGAAAADPSGSLQITLVDASTNTWSASGVFGRSTAATVYVTGGSKSLSATLDRVRITALNGTDTFDAGKINITYE